ncbi:hypothetical protein D3C81_1367170 [compost metagenome]
MQLGGIEIHAIFHVMREGIALPAAPQAIHHIHEFTRAPVSLSMLHVLFGTEIGGFVRIAGRHQIPAGAASADQVERRQAARQHIGFVVGGAGRADQAEVFGYRCQGWQQRERIERDRTVATRQHFQWRRAHGQRIGQEQSVEPGLLKHAGKPCHVRKAGMEAGFRARVAPGTGVDAGHAQQDELFVGLFHGVVILLWAVCRMDWSTTRKG